MTYLHKSEFCSKTILPFNYLITSTFDSVQTDRPALALTLNVPLRAHEVDLR